MLRTAMNISWRDHVTNKELYGSLPPLSIKVKERRMRLAGHCIRHPEEEASKVVLWQPKHGTTRQGRKNITYIDTLKDDTGLQDIDEIRSVMMDRNNWRGRIHMVRAGARPK